MARKTYTLKMTFTSTKRPGWIGELNGTVNAKSHIEVQIKAYRNWLSSRDHTETSLLVVDSAGRVLYDSKPRQESDHERGLRNADSARTQLRAWAWEGLK